MKHIAAAFGAERMQQQPAGVGIAGIDEQRDHLEIAPRLLLSPAASVGCKLFQVERVVVFRMADVAPHMAIAASATNRVWNGCIGRWETCSIPAISF